MRRGTIDLNGDVGEGFDDGPFIELLSSVNIACGAHAGDEATIERTIRLALAAGAAVGAHPGYPDREGFGRRDLPMSTTEVEASVRDQVRVVERAARRCGTELRHVKAHGALYNGAAVDPSLAAAIVRAVAAVSDRLAVVGPPGSALLEVAAAEGLGCLGEAFVDRAYERDGSLRSRRLEGAVLSDPEAVASQAVSIARDGRVTAVDGTNLAIAADTICLHGDTPGAVDNARTVRAALEATGIAVAAPRVARR